jgi:hypothetical protein
VTSNRILALGIGAIVLGLLGVLSSSGLPDWVPVAAGFAVAAMALWLGFRVRKDE